ncbi:splicing factor 3A subunit 2 [Acrasis kona]|uniref:Splicing factor 3A subunit 2 n=1 Tax=Acrasis kona TaxID=1008807 RepID=A0AAW2YWL7_9EUKA
MLGRDGIGSKTGGGGVASSSNANVDRRERLRRLALQTIDLTKDPYFMRNHLGTYECKLCLTLHNNEGNYLAHTQGKRHKTNLERRIAKEQHDKGLITIEQIQQQAQQRRVVVPRKTVKIGRPGYHVVKQRDPVTGQRSFAFEIQYPEIEAGLQPRHRFMSAFEQRVEQPPDPKYQYLLFAAEPYETIAFKIPSVPIDKSENKSKTSWDRDTCTFKLQLYFQDQNDAMLIPPPPPPIALE